MDYPRDQALPASMKGDEGADVVARLAAIGLEEREAKLYVDLLMQGASRASDAAARVRLKRTETYRALESLMEQGFVTARLTRPVEYEASAPEAVFADLLARHELRRSDIENLRESVAALAAARGRDKSEGRHGYRMIQGRRAILASTETMVRSAQENIALVSAYFSPIVATPGNRAYQEMLRRAADGVQVDLVVREHPNFERGLAALLQQKNVRVRYSDSLKSVRFLMVDGKEIVFWLVSDPAQGIEAREDVAMWTNAPDFITAQGALFDALWAQGRDGIALTSRS